MNAKLWVTLSAGLNTILLATSVQAMDARSQLEGKLWQVTSAYTNLQSQRTSFYFVPGDPRLEGRFITFSSQGIETDLDRSLTCAQPLYSTSSMTLDDFIVKAVGNEDSASANSYEMKAPGNQRIDVSQLSCQSGGNAHLSDNAIAWLAPQTILINWGDGSFIQLSPVKKEAITPSFSCVKASNETEKAICAQYSLAALDRSVLKSFEAAKVAARTLENKELMQEIIAGQKSWLQQRNQCGDDQRCIRKRMMDRMNKLTNIYKIY